MPKPRHNRRVSVTLRTVFACCAIALLGNFSANAQTLHQPYNSSANVPTSPNDRNPQIVSPGYELTAPQTNSSSFPHGQPGSTQAGSNQAGSNQYGPWSGAATSQMQPIVRGQQMQGEENSQGFSDSIPIAKLDPNGDTSQMGQPGGAKNRVLTTVTSSLVIVISLFLLLVWLTRRTMPKSNMQLPSEVVETLGRATLSNRQAMQLVRVGNKLILLNVTATGAETLTEITDADEVQRLIALCQTGQETSITSSFRQVLHQMGEEPAPPGFIGNDEDNSSDTSTRPGSRMETYHA